MRTAILLIAFMLVSAACARNAGERARSGAPACADKDVAEKERAFAKANKDYEAIRLRTVESPTEDNQRKLAEAAEDTARASADLTAAEAAGGCKDAMD